MVYNRAMYLFLSTLSGFIELGTVIYVYQQSHNLLIAVTFGLLYQFGPLLSHPIKLRLGSYLLAGLIALATSLADGSLPIQGLSLVMLSISLHGLRELSPGRTQVSTALKRWSRVAGFLVAGVFTVAILPFAAGVCLFAGSLWIKGPRSTHSGFSLSLREGPVAWVMLVHQSHYFVYAYVLPCVFLTVHQQSGWLTALWFSLGWLSYTLAEKLLGRFSNVSMIIAGHLLAAAALFGIAATIGSSLILTVALWFLTGFGGGTVYAVRRFAHVNKDSSDLDSWENIGHVLGVGLGIALLSIIPSVKVAFAVAGLLAISTAICFRSVEVRMAIESPKQDG